MIYLKIIKLKRKRNAKHSFLRKAAPLGAAYFLVVWLPSEICTTIVGKSHPSTCTI